MKANELMIGDWVLFKAKPCKVIGTTSRRIGIKIDDMLANEVYVSSVEPIPITPEILEKCGLYHIGDCDYEFLFNDGKMNLLIDVAKNPISEGIWNVKVRNGYNMVRLHSRYVHEFQHALMLCGIYKEIVI